MEHKYNRLKKFITRSPKRSDFEANVDMMSSRFELKYRLNYFEYLKIRNEISPYMKKDNFTLSSNGKGYLVRSLYYDTYHYRAYAQKANGDNQRAKFRLRTYSRSYETSKAIRVELKMRYGNRSQKESVFVPRDAYSNFLSNHHWKHVDNPITIEFERSMLINHLLPTVLIEYDREGYQARDASELRITFDHNLRSSDSNNLFPLHCFFHTHNPRTVILEIKFRDNFPTWLETIIRKHGLKVVANSKYTQGLQISRQSLTYPDHVIRVR